MVSKIARLGLAAAIVAATVPDMPVRRRKASPKGNAKRARKAARRRKLAKAGRRAARKGRK
jgi:hypothetical protein